MGSCVEDSGHWQRFRMEADEKGGRFSNEKGGGDVRFPVFEPFDNAAHTRL
jgi:hypothetical protein